MRASANCADTTVSRAVSNFRPMQPTPRPMVHPLLYELNTRCWLTELSAQQATPITLGNVPDSELNAWRESGFTHIWLMGVWTSGPLAYAEALKHPDLRRAYDRVLPDWTEPDVSGSPYAIADYQVPGALGGEAGLERFRQQLHAYGMKLVLDFVPNHLGIDHPWVGSQPEFFVQSPVQLPGTFPRQTPAGRCWLAHGKDPHFPPWTDTVQLDYRLATVRETMTTLLHSLAQRCDGVRCDMAMLLLNDVFSQTWAAFPPRESQSPSEEFWSTVLSTVKQTHPNFILLAEAYWGLESRLLALGFDYTYDKALYDLLISRDPAAVQKHLIGNAPDYIAAGAHFLENHDEARVASVFSMPEHQAAALLVLALPGLRLLHEGQLSGARAQIPVQLVRRPREPKQPDTENLYNKVFAALAATSVGKGKAELPEPRPAWPGNPTVQNFIVIQWQAQPPGFELVAVNLAPYRSQCYVPLKIQNLSAHNWFMKDTLGAEQYTRAGDDLQNQGLYLDLPPHGAQLFKFQPTG